VKVRITSLFAAAVFSLHFPALSVLSEPSAPIYVKAVYSLPLTLDPIEMNDTSSLLAGNLLYDGLLRFSPTLSIEGALAEKWSTSSDGKTLMFSLRDNIFFHDGSKITANDVVTSLKRVFSKSSRVKSLYDCIAGSDDPVTGPQISVKDERTVVISLKHPYVPFLSVLAGATAKVLPSRAATDSQFFLKPVGSGPFKYGDRKSSPVKELILLKNISYYGEQARIERLVLQELPEAEAIASAKAGKVDDLANWPIDIGNPVFEFGNQISVPVTATWIIGLNTKSAVFRNRSTRTRFKDAIDTDAFRRKFYPGAVRAYGYIPPGLPGYLDAERAIHPVLKAKEGLATGNRMQKVTIAVPRELEKAEEIKKYLESELRGKGWAASVVILPWAKLMDGYKRKTLQAFLVSMNVDYPDVDFLLRNFESKNVDNFSGLKNADLDLVISEARKERDRLRRNELYLKAAALLDHEAVTINLFHPRANYWVSKCVQGFTPNLLADVYIDYTKVSIKPGCRNERLSSR